MRRFTWALIFGIIFSSHAFAQLPVALPNLCILISANEAEKVLLETMRGRNLNSLHWPQEVIAGIQEQREALYSQLGNKLGSPINRSLGWNLLYSQIHFEKGVITGVMQCRDGDGHSIVAGSYVVYLPDSVRYGDF